MLSKNVFNEYRLESLSQADRDSTAMVSIHCIIYGKAKAVGMQYSAAASWSATTLLLTGGISPIIPSPHPKSENAYMQW